MKPEKKVELFKAFLNDNTILIVDKSSASRRRLVKTLVDMGSKRNLVQSVAHFSEAIEVLKEYRPKLILSDFSVNGGSGFDLFKEYRLLYPDEKKTVLVLITSNISQSAVAKAAEEDVDSFIIKPYTVQNLEKSLISAVIDKLHPSEYVKTIERGKEKLFAGAYEEALGIFKEAMKLNQKPALAHFYHGQAMYLVDASKEAELDYQKGLSYNSIHYKCQVGLYELFKKEGRFENAYAIIRNIAKYFPANPERLKEVIQLCMVTKNYKDMDEYYDIFLELEERTEDVVNSVCSGLYIYGKYSMINGDPAKTLEIYEKVGVSCAGKSKFLYAMIVVLVENNIFDEAKQLVSRFSNDDEDIAEYEIANFLAYSADLSPIETISNGLEIFNKGYRHPLATRILIDALEKSGNGKKANEYREEAQMLWPDKFKPNKTTA